MADLTTLLQPRIVDRESFQEFVEALDDQVPEVERDIAALRRTPDDRALIARLFRALHTIKGDAALCKVDIGVAICHPLESLLSRCREGEVRFADLLAEVMLLTLDRLELTIEAMGSGRDVGHLKLPQLVGGLEGLATASAGEIAAIARYYAAQPVAAPAAPTEIAAVGRFIHLRGNPHSGIPACKSCHGEQAHGTAQLPRLAGQHAEYTIAQLKAFHDGTRRNNLPMTQIAARLTEAEVNAVADYVAGLR